MYIHVSRNKNPNQFLTMYMPLLKKKKKDASFIYFGLNFSHTYSYMYVLSTFGFDVLSTVVYTPVLH